MNTHTIEVADPQKDHDRARCSCGESWKDPRRAMLMHYAYSHLADKWLAVAENRAE